MTRVWPLPALLTWALAWVLFIAGRGAGLAPLAAFAVALAAAAALARLAATRTRRLITFLGFPLSLLAAGAVALPAWAWLAPLAGLAVLYPMGSWRDAPLFPTPRRALQGLGRAAPLPAGAAVLDAGCGLGDGLRALRSEYPAARLTGLEWSWPLTLACRLRCRFAQVHRGDIWAAPWGDYAMVYLFQRPESMPRAVAKARAEMAPGSWLVSLEFEAPGWAPTARLDSVAGKPVWLYRLPAR